jgi:hypothetical protein
MMHWHVLGAGFTVLGMMATLMGVISQDTWTTIVGVAIGVFGVAWTYGSKLRDNSFEFLKRQNAEMANELRTMEKRIADLKALVEDHDKLELEVKRLRLELAHATGKDDNETTRSGDGRDAS